MALVSFGKHRIIKESIKQYSLIIINMMKAVDKTLYS